MSVSAPTRRAAVSAATPPRWATPDETAAYLKVCTKTVRRMIAAGELPAYRRGPRLIRINLNDVDDVMRPIPAGGGRIA